MTMTLEARLLELLVCPQCKGAVALVESGGALLCDRCKLKYPVRNGIPVMMVSEAQDLRAGLVSGTSVKLSRASFRVSAGPDAGMNFQVEQGTCRALGRTSVDPNKTAVFNIDVALALDESTRGLILQYISQQFQRSAGDGKAQADRIGLFRRVSDVAFSDPSLSRLHAMLFSDGDRVAVLDLVSKNGTYVNGQEVESCMLSRGDTIELGDTAIVFEK